MSDQLGKELRSIRHLRGLSLRQVEQRTEISNAYLSQLETGAADNPSPRVLHKLAEAYDVPYESLMRTAGFLVPQKKSTSGHSKKSVTALQAALMSVELTEEEEEQVAKYIEFLRLQRKQDREG